MKVDAPPSRRIERTDEAGRLMMTAIVQCDSAIAVVSVHVEAGHHPTGICCDLVGEAIGSPEVAGAGQVVTVLPRTEPEAVLEAQQRLTSATTRSAGATVIVEGGPPG
jgi:hypothetical protein